MGEKKKDVQYDAPWAENLRHHPDPNRVHPHRIDSAVILSEAKDLRPEAASTSPSRLLAPLGMTGPGQASYYDVPMLKQPVWKWQIASYFYFGGLSAGAYLIGRVAERFGGDRYCNVSRMASYVAMAALMPSPPLLIWDLGDPKRFHHMLRVWKPGTPMNLGTWSIVAYSGMTTYEVVRQYLSDRGKRLGNADKDKLLKLMNNGVLLAIHDAAGIPFSLMVAGYTGVLLSCTANPLWCKNPFLGPLFSASAIATGAEAISLALDLFSKSQGRDEHSQSILQNIDSVAHAAELACAKGFMKFAGERAKPLKSGSMKTHHRLSLGGIVAAEVLKRLPVNPRLRRPVRMLAAALGLAAGFSMRWSMVFAGHAAAADPQLCRSVSETEPRAKRIRTTRPRSTPAQLPSRSA